MSRAKLPEPVLEQVNWLRDQCKVHILVCCFAGSRYLGTEIVAVGEAICRAVPTLAYFHAASLLGADRLLVLTNLAASDPESYFLLASQSRRVLAYARLLDVRLLDYLVVNDQVRLHWQDIQTLAGTAGAASLEDVPEGTDQLEA